MRGISQVLLGDSAQRALHFWKSRSFYKEREDDASQLNRLIYYMGDLALPGAFRLAASTDLAKC